VDLAVVLHHSGHYKNELINWWHLAEIFKILYNSVCML